MMIAPEQVDADVAEVTRTVQRRTGMESYDHAEQAVRATLTVLAQRLSAEGTALIAQLPAGLAACVAADAVPEQFGLDEFYRRVARLEGRRCTVERGRRHARAVTTTLQEMAVAVHRLVTGSLPAGWSDLVPAGAAPR